MAIPHATAQEYDQYKSSLNVCIPVMVIGVTLAAYGGLMAWRRRRPGMAMLGAIGALLAGGLGILGAILAVIALAAITLSRDEFEEQGAPPPKEKGGTPEE
jgi:prolipoprotein diacylglyceryltransferase